MTEQQKEFIFILLTMHVPNWQFKHMIINNNINIKLDNLDNISDFHARLIISLLKENKGINYYFEWDEKYKKEIIDLKETKAKEELEKSNIKVSEILKKMREKKDI